MQECEEIVILKYPGLYGKIKTTDYKDCEGVTYSVGCRFGLLWR